MASIAAAALTAALSMQPLTVYLAPDDHTDYLWSATEEAYARYFPRSLDFYLAQIDATAHRDSDFQMRWNVDGSMWMWEFERARTPAQFQRLMERVRDGHVSMPLNTTVSVHGASPLEAVVRDMYYAGRLERRYGLRFTTAVAMENQTASFGLASVWAGAGARYTWKGVCGRYAGHNDCTRVAAAGDRQFDAYWWQGPDGSRILTKWNSELNALPSARDSNQGPGGYAEARYPQEAVGLVTHSAAFRARWPYDIIGLFGAGWDDADDYLIDLDDPVSSQTRAAQRWSSPSLRVVVSNQLDFFRAFEQRYGASLPVQTVGFGNEWELNLAQFAAKSARLRRAVERLRAAEAMMALAQMEEAHQSVALDGERDIAFRNMGLYFEHNMGGGGQFAPAQRVEFQERMLQGVELYVMHLEELGRQRLTNLIASGAGDEVVVFNPLGFSRTDVAEADLACNVAVRVTDLRSGRQVPAQWIGEPGSSRVRFLAADVPGFGLARFRVECRAGHRFPAAARFLHGRLSSRRYRLIVDERGAIVSLIDRLFGEREWVKRADGRTPREKVFRLQAEPDAHGG